MKTFAAFLQPLRERLRALAGRAEPWTLVCDAGASSQKNLESLEPEPDYYVTSVRPSPDMFCFSDFCAREAARGFAAVANEESAVRIQERVAT
ncbi:MAG: hypothetical protein ACLQVL_05885 [Terriglobia bacterium]